MSTLRRGLERRRNAREAGFVMVTTTVTLTLLLIFASFAVDIGGWYVRAAEIKRAADAAALAGVVWMPEIDVARAKALEAAERNGFKNGSGDISVSVEEVEGENRQIRVTITDGRVYQFLSGTVVDRQSITRTSTAEYVLPVPLGSPKNTFGTGTLLSGSDRENFWAAVNGWCAGHESGDDKLARNESYSTASGSSECNNSSPQSDNYDPNGYLYAINLPANATTLTLQVYDPAYNRSSSPSDTQVASGNQNVTTYFQVYDRNSTPLDLSNLTPLGGPQQFVTNQNQSVNQNRWVTLATWNQPKAGQYYLRVYTAPNELNSRASNGFAIRAYTGSSFSTCTTITGSANYSASCPQVHGVSDISILANGPNATSDFYLAQVDPIHAGKTMRVTLFDAGEGSNTLQILDPNGTATSFTWSTACNPPTPPAGSCSGTGTSLDVSATGAQPYTGLQSSSKYNDRYMVLDIPLPANYSALYGSKRWWKVRYIAGSNPTDRTTWSVNIVGDPVHLLK